MAVESTARARGAVYRSRSELLWDVSLKVTADVYMQALTEGKRNDHDGMIQLLVPHSTAPGTASSACYNWKNGKLLNLLRVPVV